MEHAGSCLTIITTLVSCYGQSIVPVCSITCHDMRTSPDIVLSLCVKIVCLINLLVINWLLEHILCFMFNKTTHDVSYTSTKWMKSHSSNQLDTIGVSWCSLIYCRLEQIVIIYHTYCFSTIICFESSLWELLIVYEILCLKYTQLWNNLETIHKLILSPQHLTEHINIIWYSISSTSPKSY